jgi:threonine dehydrogenase-like Zn-dependent dehydrogenase
VQALVFRGPGELAWEEVPTPEIKDPRDALVRPIAVARCDLDPAIALGLYPMTAPFVMGHEMVGEVVAVGDAAGLPAVGDRVIVPFQLSCGGCATCLRGHTNACELVAPGTAFGLGPHGGVDLGGALADLVRVPWADVMCIPLPDGLDPVVATGIPDNVADGYRCVAEPLGTFPGAPVLVVGGLASSVGLHAVMAAVALGAEQVVYVDDDAERLSEAERLGARPVDATGRWGDPGIGRRFPICGRQRVGPRPRPRPRSHCALWHLHERLRRWVIKVRAAAAADVPQGRPLRDRSGPRPGHCGPGPRPRHRRPA